MATTNPQADAGTHAELTSEAGAANQAQACKTLPRTFAIAPKDYYFVYPSVEAAVTDLRSAIPQWTYLDAGNEFQARGEAAAAKAFEGYKKLYPNLVEGLSGPPQVVILDNDEFNASALGASVFTEKDGRHTTPYVFFYNKGFFVDGITDAQITMVTAHELGHLILRNATTPDDFQDIYYRETEAERGKIYGEYEKNEPDVQDLTQRVQNSADRVGVLVAPELHGIPTRIGAHIPENAYVQAPLYTRMVRVLYDMYASSSPHPDDCTAAPANYNAFMSLVASHITVDSKLDFGTDGANVEAAALAYETAVTSCLSHVSGRFAQALELLKKKEDPNYETNIAAVGDDPQKLADYLQISNSEIAADNDFPDMTPVEKIFLLGKAQMSGLGDTFTDPKIRYSELRDYTAEDDSDEAAVRVAKLIGVDSDELSNALFLGAGPSSAATAKSCRDLLASGGAPEYGGAGDPHHGGCWRAYRNSKLKTALQSCSAGWPSTP